MKVLHISDVHLSPDRFGGTVRGGGWRRLLAQVELKIMGRERRYRNAEGVLARILAEANVDHVILSGDVTVLSLEDEFAMVRRVLGPLAEDPRRLTVVPGNHDRYTPGSLSHRRFERHFEKLLDSDLPEHVVHGRFPIVRLVGEELAVVGLDSAIVPPVPGLAFGRVGEAQLRALEAILEDPRLRGRGVLVTLHHAPYNHRLRPEPWTHGLRGSAALLDLCARHGVAGVLHGHVHERYRLTCPRSGVELFGGGSSTEAGNEGYWLLDVDGRGLASAEQVSVPVIEGVVPAF